MDDLVVCHAVMLANQQKAAAEHRWYCDLFLALGGYGMDPRQLRDVPGFTEQVLAFKQQQLTEEQFLVWCRQLVTLNPQLALQPWH